MEMFKVPGPKGKDLIIPPQLTELLEKNEIINVYLNEELQNKCECRIGLEVTIDKPWRTICKEILLEDSKIPTSVFSEYAEPLKELKDPEVIVGYDTSDVHGSNFFICMTLNAREKILDCLKTINENYTQIVLQSDIREVGEWTDLGSASEIQESTARNNRPLINIEWKGDITQRINRPVQFSKVLAGSTPGTYAQLGCLEREGEEELESETLKNIQYYYKNMAEKSETIRQVLSLLEDKAVQASTRQMNVSCQTIAIVPFNVSTQINPEIEALEKQQYLSEPVDGKSLNQFFKKYEKTLFEALSFNSEYDLYENDYEQLVKSGEVLEIYPVLEYKPFVTFVDMVNLEGYYITDTSWHPKYSGIVAVSYGRDVLCEVNELESDSDESDYELKQRPPRTYPKVSKKKILSELVQAKEWVRMAFDIKKSEGKNEDSSLYKLASATLNCLHKSLLLREAELRMEEEHENLIPELDELNFSPDLTYKVFEEEDVSCADIIRRLEDKIFENPTTVTEYRRSRFEEKLKQYQTISEGIVTASETISFDIVWEGRNWLAGNHLKEEALRVHRRNFANAEDEVGQMEMPPLDRQFFPFREKSIKKKKPFDSKRTRSSVSSLAKILSNKKRSILFDNKIMTKEKVSPEKEKDLFSKQQKKFKKFFEHGDEDDENSVYNILSTEHPVLVWWLDDDLRPLLLLDCPREINSLSFCPHNGNILAGGTTSGQVVLWDLKGSLPPKDTLEDSSKKVDYELKRKMKWFKDLKVKKWIKFCAATDLNVSHKNKIVNVRWVYPTYELSYGHFSPLRAEEGKYSSQILTTSMDGVIKMWDLSTEPEPKLQYRHVERLVGVRHQYARPPGLSAGISPLTRYHQRWLPKYNINVHSGKRLPLNVTTIEFQPKLTTFERITEPKADKMTDIIEYKIKAAYDEECRIEKNAFAGTLAGDVAFIEWKGLTELEGESFEVTHAHTLAPIHDGPISGVARHPIIENIALSVGGHVFAIWNTLDMTWPILWKRYYKVTVTCGSWSPLRPSLFRIGRSDGYVEIWDLLLQSDKPKIVFPTGGRAITCFSSPLLKMAKGLLGVADSKGALILKYIPWFYQLWKKSELDTIMNLFTKEPLRRAQLKELVEHWKATEDSTIRPTESESMGGSIVYPKRKKTYLMKHTVDTDGNKKEECRKFFRDLYRWYMKRKQANVACIVEKEDKRILNEEDHAVKTLLANKNVDMELLKKQMQPLVDKENLIKQKEVTVLEMLADADTIFNLAVVDIFIEPEEKTEIEVEDNADLSELVAEIELLFGDHSKSLEDEELVKIKNCKIDSVKSFEDLVRNCKERRRLFNDPRRWIDPQLRWMRAYIKKEVEKTGHTFILCDDPLTRYKIKKYRKRLDNIEELKKQYGAEYDPFWDFDKPIKHKHVEREKCCIPTRLKSMSFSQPSVVTLSSGLDLDNLLTLEDISKEMAKEFKQATTLFEKPTKTVEDVEYPELYGEMGEGEERLHEDIYAKSESSEEDHREILEELGFGEELKRREKEPRKELDIRTILRLIDTKDMDDPDNESYDGYELIDEAELGSNCEIVYTGYSVPSPGSSPASSLDLFPDKPKKEKKPKSFSTTPQDESLAVVAPSSFSLGQPTEQYFKSSFRDDTREDLGDLSMESDSSSENLEEYETT